MEAVHCFQDAIATALYGQVDILADVRVFCHRINHIEGHILRIGSRKADTHFRLSYCHHIEEFSEVDSGGLLHLTCFAKILFESASIPKVTIHILPQEGNLFKSTRLEVGYFVEDRIRVTTAFTSASERYNAESTHIVTTARNRYKSCYTVAIETDRRNIGIGFVLGENHIYRFTTFFHFFK